jgi:transposase
VSLAEALGAAKAARELGISVKTVAKWIRIARDEGIIKDGKTRSMSERVAEVARARAEKARLRVEQEFLEDHSAAIER